MIRTGRLVRILAPTAVLVLASVVAQAQGNQSPSTGGDVPVIQTVAATFGEVRGRVTDAEGAPLDGAMVSASALGTARVAFAVCDAEGRFDLRSLPVGAYLLRAHLEGFATSRHWIDVKPNIQTVGSFVLRRGFEAAATADASVPSLVQAGFVSSASQPDLEVEGVESIDEPTESSPSPHDHSEKAWRLRHLRRSILKEVIGGVETLQAGRTEDSPVLPGTVPVLGRAIGASARLARMLMDDLPFSGQFSLLTSSALDRSADLGSDDARPSGAAYLAIGAPVGDGDWSVRSAIANGEVSSWVLAGAYTGDAHTHALDVGMSFGGQGNDQRGLVAGDTLDAGWTVGSVHAFDNWSPSRKLAVDYGAQYARYDYVERTALFSPRVGVTVSPLDRTHVRVMFAQRMVAPGAGEILLPPTNGLWLPPEHRFASLSPEGSLHTERARHVEFAVEHELAGAYVVGVRRFFQGVDDQLVTMFGVDTPNGLPGGLGNYYLASAGRVNADGWGVSLNRSLPGRVRGRVDYSLTRARWARAQEPAQVGHLVPSALRPETEVFHDVTTSVETEIPETSTRVFVLWRWNTAYAMSGTGAEGPGFDGRFDIHVRQGLPFAPLDGSTWELLVAVRSLFREPWAEASTYDELLVVRPPKRVVGGLLVRF